MVQGTIALVRSRTEAVHAWHANGDSRPPMLFAFSSTPLQWVSGLRANDRAWDGHGTTSTCSAAETSRLSGLRGWLLRYTGALMLEDTKTDRIIRWIKDHRVFSTIAAAVIVLGSITAVLDHTTAVFDRFHSDRGTAVSDAGAGKMVFVTFRDGVKGQISVSVIYQLLPQDAMAMIKDVGTLDDAVALLTPMAVGATVTALESRTYAEFQMNRGGISAEILAALKEKAAGIHLTIHEVTLGPFRRA